MKKEILPIVGLHCASCKNLIEKKLSKVEGIHNISVNYGSEKVTLEYDENILSKEDIKKHISHLGKYNLITENSMHHSHEEHAQMLKDEQLKKLKTRVTVAGITALLFFFTMIYMILLPVFHLTDIGMILGSITLGSLNYSVNTYLLIQFILSSLVVFYCGKDILESAYTALKVRTTNMDTLISVGTLIAWLYSTVLTFFPNTFSNLGNASNVYFEATVFIFFFILLGRYLENNAKGRANNSVQELIKLQVKDAVILKDGKEVKVAVENLKIGDIVIVRPGEKIAIDGEIVEGYGVIDQSMISGEPIPVERKVGDMVIGSTICVSGSLKFKVSKKGNETLLSQIIEKVQEAQASQAPIQKLVDKVSAIFIPVVFLLSVAALLFWLFAGTYFGISSGSTLQFSIYIFITVLIIACPCALGLATPMAIIAGTGLGAKEGILIKNAEVMEKLNKVKTIVFDKTGTLTKGKPSVTSWQWLTKSDNKYASYISALEKQSQHPLSQAIVKHLEGTFKTTVEIDDFKNIDGVGVTGKVNGKTIGVGNLRLLERYNIKLDKDLKKSFDTSVKKANTAVFTVVDKKVVALISIADEIKDEAIGLISKLNDGGYNCVMLTGDNESTAKYIATTLGITKVISDVLPTEKADKIKELKQAMPNNELIVMVGDGINDAPALAQADVGIAMGNGSDIAMETGQVVIVGGNLSKIYDTLVISKKTISIIKQNLFWAFGYNIIGIPIAAGLVYPLTGLLLSPIMASAAMAFSSISVVLNSLRLSKK